MFPVFLNLRDRLGVVIGGGPVGRRKAQALLEAGARVRLVCLETRWPEEQWQSIDWIMESYSPEHLAGAVLVFAAATPELNQRIVADAKERGLWVNAADDPDSGDLYLPATVRRGSLVIAIGTGGAAPALARQVRLRLERLFDDAYARWVALLAELRPLVLATIADPQRRRLAFERLCRWEWLRRLRKEEAAFIKMAMQAEVDALAADGDSRV